MTLDYDQTRSNKFILHISDNDIIHNILKYEKAKEFCTYLAIWWKNLSNIDIIACDNLTEILYFGHIYSQKCMYLCHNTPITVQSIDKPMTKVFDNETLDI